ncbi:hypothetical protein ACFPIK_10005 [Algoriphagus aquatilis]|uniref:Uncharacterized protein n=1 Tax=Algoriphagus aquatilis TaxID=490186 RepID=A0ABW0BX95_9BACT
MIDNQCWKTEDRRRKEYLAEHLRDKSLEVEANSSKKSALISEFFSEDLREKAGRRETQPRRAGEDRRSENSVSICDFLSVRICGKNICASVPVLLLALSPEIPNLHPERISRPA